MDRSVIKAFWRDRAAAGRTRWTDDGLMEFELRTLEPLVRDTARILDLGSGFGELSRQLCPAGGKLVAVDAEGGFGPAFEGDDRFSFFEADVETFSTDNRFDLVLLFGVVTHLDEPAEEAAYRKLASLAAPNAVCVVKNQCADDASFEVDGWSSDLGRRYVGRYPSVTEQGARLDDMFSKVDVAVYPPRFKLHANSSHVMFVCRHPRRDGREAPTRMD